MITRVRALLVLRRLVGTIFALLIAGSAAGAEMQSSNSSVQVTETSNVPEYLVKSAMLYHFTRFTKWPQGTFDDPDIPYRFCVIGEDPFGPNLDALVGKTIGNRDIVTLRLKKIRHAKDCHLLFIADSEKEKLPKILEQLADRSILTIADMEDFARDGGIIQLKLVEDRVRFQINLSAAQRIGITFRSELLLLAEIISGEFKRDRFDVLSQ